MRLKPGPVFEFECITAARRWQLYATRVLFVTGLLAAMVVMWESQAAGPSPTTARTLVEVGAEATSCAAQFGSQLALVLLAAAAFTAGAICIDHLAEDARARADDRPEQHRDRPGKARGGTDVRNTSAWSSSRPAGRWACRTLLQADWIHLAVVSMAFLTSPGRGDPRVCAGAGGLGRRSQDARSVDGGLCILDLGLTRLSALARAYRVGRAQRRAAAVAAEVQPLLAVIRPVPGSEPGRLDRLCPLPRRGGAGGFRRA